MDKKIPEKVKKAIKEYIRVVRSDVSVERVVLYGSYAQGIARKDSDIDIAIISKEFGKNPHQEGKFLFRKLWEVDNSGISPIGYSPKEFSTQIPSPLLSEIRKHGKEIKISNK
jgi:uncharacterized protein